ncbi:MAG: FecR domain-containing protein [Burkholderiales bacterium]|nr:FecR domain-containing protein [Burkholderiales bacterium]
MPQISLRVPSRPVLLALCMLVVAPTGADAQTGAGSVEFVSGEATLRSAAGVSRPATRGSAINSGDSIETAQGRVQLRMVDGAYISLQPQTLLRVEDYQMAGSTAAEERGFLGLLRGGLRTVTGSIGRINRGGYRLTTPTATVGIRGTAFSVSADAGTRLAVSEGIAALCNNGGCVDVGAGQSGFAPDAQTRPALAFRAPSLPPSASGQQSSFVVAENRNNSGQSVTVAASGSTHSGGSGGGMIMVPLPSGAGGVAIASTTSAGVFSAGLLGGTNTFGPGGELNQFTDGCCAANNFTATAVADNGADGIIAWGRWTNGGRGSPPNPLIMVHYAANLSANAVTATSIIGTYDVYASSAPTITSGGTVVATGTSNSVTGSMNVNFPNLTSGGTLTYNLSIPVAAQTFTINGAANQFSGSAFLGSTSTITSSGAACTPSCTGNIPFGNAIQGFFTGTAAQRAGANYGFTSALGQVSGAVVMRPPGAPP